MFAGSNTALMGKSIQDSGPRLALKAQVGFANDFILEQLFT
jgi:hypothetical protein